MCPRLVYSEGFLFCSNCVKHFKAEDCPIHHSATQKFPICPECPGVWRMRTGPHNKRWYVYYQKVIKPNFEKNKDVIVKYKWDHPRRVVGKRKKNRQARAANNNKKE